MANWEVGNSFKTIVKWYLIEKALGLPHVDWDTRHVPLLCPQALLTLFL